MWQYNESYYSRGRSRGIAGALGSIVSCLSQTYLARRLTSKFGSGRVLEVGFGDGSFLEKMAALGWEADGIETSDTAIEMAREKTSINAWKGDMTDSDLEESSYDLVIMRHVLEHMDNPDRAFARTYEILCPNGAVFIAVPNIESIEAKIAGDKWFHLDPAYHKTHYSPQTIKNALRIAGFRDIKINHFSIDYRQTLMYSIMSRIGLDPVSKDATASQRAILIALLPVGVVLSFACSLVRRGGTIEVTARRL